MNPATLTAFLTPFLPTLLNLGNQAATTAAVKVGETAGIQLTESAFEKAKAVWGKLRPRIEAKAAAREAVEDVAKTPDDADLQVTLRVQIKKILDADPDLAAAIAQILEENSADGTARTDIVQTVTGNQNQVIGQVSGGQVIGNFTSNLPSDDTSRPTPHNAYSAPCKKILILAANPRDIAPLQLAEEVRNLQERLERALHRDRFTLEQRWAVSTDEVRLALFNVAPHIVHFSGHGIRASGNFQPIEQSRKFTPIAYGTEDEGLVFQDPQGRSQIVSGEALAQLFSLFAHQIECVVLNACYSSLQAKAIARHIPYVIGMKQEIGDRAALQFSKGFYDAIFAGEAIEVAYRSGCNAIQMENIPEHLTPVIEKAE